MSNNELKEKLQRYKREWPTVVGSRLEKGFLVRRTFGTFYEIDNPNIDRNLGNYVKGKVPTRAIYERLKPNPVETQKIAGGRNITPFSEVFNRGVGQCTEKSILVQLAAQRGGDSFIISGAMSEGDDPVLSFHTYNIVFRDGKAHLVDAENPIAIDPQFIPYILEIVSLNNKREFEFVQNIPLKRIYTF